MSVVAFRVLEDDAEELSYHFLVGEPELDLPVCAARSYKCFVEAFDIIGCHDQHPAFL
jgi:hypothetical protein